MENTFEQYLEMVKDYNIPGANGLKDYETWAKEDEKFQKFISNIKSNPSKKYKVVTNSPGGSIEAEWLPDKNNEEKLDIWFLNNDGSPDRPIANSWRYRIWYHLIEK